LFTLSISTAPKSNVNSTIKGGCPLALSKEYQNSRDISSVDLFFPNLIFPIWHDSSLTSKLLTLFKGSFKFIFNPLRPGKMDTRSLNDLRSGSLFVWKVADSEKLLANGPIMSSSNLLFIFCCYLKDQMKLKHIDQGFCTS
jgi:hypothetical protein